MSVTVVDADIVAEGVAASYGSDTDILIRAGIAVISTGDTAIEHAGNARIVNFGTVWGFDHGLLIADADNGAGYSVVNAAGATIAGDQAVYLGTSNGPVSLRNSGAIEGDAGGILAVNTSNLIAYVPEIVNDGTISALGVAVWIDREGTLVNDGMIRGGTAVVIDADDWGSRREFVLINTGTITAVGYPWAPRGTAIDTFRVDQETFTGAPYLISNTGTITGDIDLRATQSAILTNGGTITGQISTGRGHDTLTNAGMILGQVILGIGNDSYLAQGEGLVSGLVRGNEGDDTLTGAGANDVLAGDSGIDDVGGRGGDDELSGGSGRDRLSGGAGDDSLAGGPDADRMKGGGGQDVFIFQVRDSLADDPDTITDFQRGQDLIDLPGFARTPTFIGAADFAGNGTAQLRAVLSGSTVTVEVDVNGDGRAEFRLLCLNQTRAFGLADFAL